MNERIRHLRRSLDLTQVEFAKRLGLVQNTITAYEKGRICPSEQVILSICREFNVNETWLRTGNGKMFHPLAGSEIDLLAKKYDLSRETCILIERFIDLKKEQRQAVIDFIKKAAASLANLENGEEE